MKLGITVSVRGVAAMSRREMNDVLKEAWHLLALRWLNYFLPLHFGDRATQRYGYEKRSWRYNYRKKRIVGHTRPMEFTGQTKRQALRQHNVIASSKQATARINAPGLNRRPKTGRIRMRDEVTAIRDDELAALRKFMGDHLRRTFHAIGQRAARVVIR